MRIHPIISCLLGLTVISSGAEATPSNPSTPSIPSIPAAPPDAGRAVSAPAQIWIPGEWEWTGSHSVWHVGHWLQDAPPSQSMNVWTEGRWLRDRDDRWVWVPGHYESTQSGQPTLPPPVMSASNPAHQGQSSLAPPVTAPEQNANGSTPSTVVITQSAPVYQDQGAIDSSAYYDPGYANGYYDSDYSGYYGSLYGGFYGGYFGGNPGGWRGPGIRHGNGGYIPFIGRGLGGGGFSHGGGGSFHGGGGSHGGGGGGHR
jgi:hypothetical protein